MLMVIRDSRGFYRNQELRPKRKKSAPRIIASYTQQIGYGLTDRLKGMVSLYEYAKQYGLDFYIDMCQPFSLEDYLVPASYDWRIVASVEESKLFILLDSGTYKMYLKKTGKPYNQEEAFETYQWVLDKIVNLDMFSELHITTNVAFAMSEFGPLYRELFAPVCSIQHEIDIWTKVLNQYVVACFRFTNLLNDTDEKVGTPKSKEEQINLMNRCCQRLEQVMVKHETSNVLVTSDSRTFIDFVETKAYNRVFYIKGEKIHHHMGFTQKKDCLSFQKAFLEFEMIGRASHVYQIQLDDMYCSFFPEAASKLNENSHYMLLTNNSTL